MKKAILLLLLAVRAFAVSSVSLPYIVDTAAIPKVRYVDKNDSALKFGVNQHADTLNAASGSGNLVRQTGATITSPTLNTGATWSDGANITVGSTTGSKIGTATSQKLGFFNATPVVQPTSAQDVVTNLQNLGLLASGTYNVTGGTGTFSTLNGTGLTASRILATDGSKNLASVADLSSWIGGTTNRVTVTANGSGGVTLSGPQDLATSSTPTFGAVNLNMTGSNAQVLATGAGSSNFYGILSGQSARGSIGSPTISQNNDIAGRFIGGLYDGSTYLTIGDIRFEADGAPAASNTPGRIVFKVNSGSTGANTEAFRIINSGAVQMTNLTASTTLGLDASKNIVSVTNTGSGNAVRATSPTIASPTFTGTIATPLSTSLAVFTDGSGNLTTNALTGTGSVMMSASPTTTGTLTAAAVNMSGDLTINSSKGRWGGTNGNMVIGTGTVDAASWLNLTGTSGLTGTTNYGIFVAPTFQSTSTSAGYGIGIQAKTQATSFTQASTSAIHIFDVSKGAGSTITTQTGLEIDNQTQGGTNYAIKTGTGLVQFGGLTASQGLETDGSKNLISAAFTGTGNHVRATSPTFSTSAIFNGYLQPSSSGSIASYQAVADPTIYASSSGGGAYPFLENGNLIISPRTSASGAERDIVFVTAATGTPALAGTVKRSTGNWTFGGSTDNGFKVEVTGTMKVSSTVNLAGLSAGVPVFTDGSKNLTTGTLTGSGTVLATNTSPSIATPTFTGAVTGGSSFTNNGTTDNASTLQNNGSFSKKESSLSGNTTLDATYSVIEASATGSSFTITLPSASGCSGREYTIHKNDASTNTVTIARAGSDVIDGATSVILCGNTGNSHLTIRSNGGTSWRIEDLYEEGTISVQLKENLGGTPANIGAAQTWKWVRNGNQVTIQTTSVSGTSAASDLGTNTTPIPSPIRPKANSVLHFAGVINSGSTLSTGAIQLPTTGDISFFITEAGGAFTSSGSKGLAWASWITYSVL